jgi:dTDP-4-dehydrorhamnose reductase
MAARTSLLVTGCRGQLGRDLVRMLAADYEVTGVDMQDFDITDTTAVATCLKDVRPNVLIHAAADTDVDGCETRTDRAMAVNAEAVGTIAANCREVKTRMIYYSTDYVFDGNKAEPYVEDDPPHPMTVYGQSKLEGERLLADRLDDYAILRIGWLYGAGGRNFVKTMLQEGQNRLKSTGSDISPITVVDDQVGTPTWTVDVVRQTAEVIERNLSGLFHATAEGECSWFEFARDIFDIADLPVPVEACLTARLNRPASRPARSTLENQRLKAIGANRMRPYRKALEEFLRQYGGEADG